MHGFTEKYEISDLGNIRRISGKKPLSRKVQNGYWAVQLFVDGKPKNIKVHRLVMLSFHGESDKHVNHIDWR